MSALDRLTPRASLRTRLLVASLLWTAIGTGLLIAGVHWLLAAGSAAWLAALPLALGMGWVKGRFLLMPRVTANTARIVAAGDGRCIGGVFSWSSWGLAALMIAGGAALRRSPLPRPWLGLLYSAIGTALGVASLASWRSWRQRS